MICLMCSRAADKLAEGEIEPEDAENDHRFCIGNGCTCQHRVKKEQA